MVHSEVGKRKLRLHRGLTVLTLLALTLAALAAAAPASAVPTVPAPNAISGIVYQDLNATGARETPIGEPGVPGVTVTAYGADGLSCGSVITAADGSFSLSNTCPGPVRLEFSTLPTWARSGPQGSSSGTSVQFVANNATGVLFGINNPANYSSKTPFLATPWQVPGDNVSSDSFPTRNTLTTMSAAWGGVSSNNWLDPWQAGGAPIQLAQAAQTGTLYGLAWQRSTGKLFAGAYYKHFAGFGQNGAGDKSGAIYSTAIDPATGDNTAAPVLFADANTFSGVDVSCPARPRSAGTGNDQFDIPPLYSDTTIANIGKCSLGDLDISDDDSTLFAMDLKNRQVLRINAATGAYLGAWPVPTSGLPLASGACPTGDVRPFGMGYHNGQLYVGAVCSAESTVSGTANGTPANLHAYVWKVDSAGTYTLILNYQIIADRFDDMGSGTSWRNWNPWKSTRAQIAAQSHPTFAPANYLHPQPMLVDIEFYGEDMILGFRDRLGDQWGSQVPVSGTPVEGIAAGDIKCAAWNGSSYALEVGAAGSGTTCGGRTASGAGEGDGNSANPTSSGHEFYWGDGDPTGSQGQDATEYAMGALAQWTIEPLAQTAVDSPVAFNVGYYDNNGVNRLDNTGGAATKGYVMFDGKMDIGAWGKASGLGDLEALKDPAPIEVGNRVWNDADGNGRQDPGESGIDGVAVGLYCGGNQVGQATTANGGQYYFGGVNNRNMLPGATSRTVTVAVAASSDDADEVVSGGAINLTRNVLNMPYNTTPALNLVGLRFNELNIPPGSTITGASITFTASGADSSTVNLTIRGEAADSAATFTATAGSISSRTTTTAGVNWTPGAWSSGSTTNATTPSLANVVQEIVNRPGWSAGNSMAFVVSNNATTSSNRRRARSADNTNGGAPVLSVTYTLPNSIPANTSCEVRVATGQAPLSDLVLSPANTDGLTSNDAIADVRDSDATVSGGNAVIVFTTGGPGENNHGLDLGFAPLRDYGDAPDAAAGTATGNYNTTAGDNGPNHTITQGLNLGNVAPDGDSGALQNVAADADDTTGSPDDEDGIATLPTITTGATSLDMTARATNGTGTPAKLACWIDFNRDGDFLDTGERSATVVVPASSGGADYTVSFSGFGAPVAGDSYIRCRLAYDPAQVADPTGAASSGEVEDFKVVIAEQQLDYGDLPDTGAGTGAANYNTTAADDGARHVVVQGVHLGAGVDADNGALQNAAATADDTSNTGAPDDEDGVQFLTPLMPGTMAKVRFQASIAGCLSGWADWNGDGALDALKIAAGSPTGAPGNNLVELVTPSSFFDVWLDLTAAPANAATGVIYTRFRFTQACLQGGGSPTGLATSGEAEDYALASLGDYVWDDANGNGQQDDGEPLRGGVTVRLLDASGNPIKDAGGNPITDVTDGTGRYEFPGLPPGSYKVEFVPPAGYMFTTPDTGNDATDSDANPATGQSGTVMLVAGEVNATVDAGLIPQQLDYGDLPDTGDGTASGNYNTTAADNGAAHAIVQGVYLGAGIDADNGTLQNNAATADDTSDTGSTDDEDGVQFLTPLAPGAAAQLQVTASVAGCLNAWVDWNGDGDLLDAGEQIATDLAAHAGANVIGIAAVPPTSGVVYSRFRFTQACGQGGGSPTGVATTGEVEDYALASLGDYVWEDADKDGQQDDGEAPRAEVTVILLDATGNPVKDANGVAITTTTNGSGLYEFPGLPPGSYSVEFVPPPGFSFTTPNTGADTTDSDADLVSGRTSTVSLAAGEINATLDAGLFPVSGVAIGNFIWCDITPNGIWDTGEPGLGGVTVRLYGLGGDTTPYTSDDNLVDTLITDGDGHYTFLAETPGKYYVAVLKSTLPLGCATYSSPGGGGNPDLGDQDAAGGDDGIPGPTPDTTTLVVSGVVDVTPGGQTTVDSGDPIGYADTSAYMTVDFAFYTGTPTAVTINGLQARAVSPVERLIDWLRQQLGQ